MSTRAKKAFLEALEEIILRPRKLPYKVQFTGPTSTNAVEAAMKLARKVKKRTNIVSFTNAFHGNTTGSVAATGNAFFRKGAGVPLQNVTFMPYDGFLGEDLDTLPYIRKYLGDGHSGVDRPAAVLIETVQGEGGVNVAGREWLQGLQALCRELDVLLIVDDIQVGCGRTGAFFSFEELGVTPDMVLLSKSLSGYGLPLSVVLLKPELDQWQPGEHNGTFRGNSLAFVTATAALHHFWKDGRLAQEVRSKSQILSGRLDSICARYGDEGFRRRGRGLIQGLDLGAGERAEQVRKNAFERGLIIETCGGQDEIVKFLPPLTVDVETLRRGIRIVEECVEELIATPELVEAEVRR
jgi:diaminobutyrate-2-oxoglutarate transaminase